LLAHEQHFCRRSGQRCQVTTCKEPNRKQDACDSVHIKISTYQVNTFAELLAPTATSLTLRQHRAKKGCCPIFSTYPGWRARTGTAGFWTFTTGEFFSQTLLFL